ncbi:replication initiator protein A [Microbulbifer sp. PSTR4-B]|uniref:replication initiator protein A n=1 Tax=unclassified Microbulbifer TaxID=2619833 RepID=UPI00403B05C7
MANNDKNQLELFIADILDVAPKGDMLTMEHPIFSLSKRRDTRKWVYKNGENWIEVTPSADGRATMHDKDVLMYCIGQVVEGLNRGREVSRRVQIVAYDFFRATHRDTGGKSYAALHDALARLRGTTFKTNIMGRRGVFGLVDDAEIIERDNRGRMANIEVTLSKQLFEAAKRMEVLTYNPGYFDLSSANDRRMYELARKHCGKQPTWSISMDKLFIKFGSTAARKEFNRMVSRMVKADRIPDYSLMLENGILTVISRSDAVWQRAGALEHTPELELE